MRASVSLDMRRGSLVRPGLDKLPEVCVPTATAIVYDCAKPFLILVGESRKHSRPVLPGGKIERADIVSSSMIQNAAHCIRRELSEEIHLADAKVSLHDVVHDPEGDKRCVPARVLRATLAEDAVRGFEDDQDVLARYGVPDFIFLVPANAGLVSSSEELISLEWVDCRLLEPGSLGAAHSSIVRRYSGALTA